MSSMQMYRNDFTGNNVVQNYHQHKIDEQEKLEVKCIIELIQQQRNLRNEISLKNLHLLDLGCGQGGVTRHLASHFGHVIGVDLSPDQIRQAKEVANPENAEFRVGVAEDIPVDSKSIDVITAFYSLHFTEVAEFVKECRRVLKPGGMALFYADIISNVRSNEYENLPDTADQIKEMYRKYSEIAKQSSHPEIHLIDRYRTLYENSIVWPEKNYVETDLADLVLSLYDVKHSLMAVPFYQRLGTNCDKNPLAEYVDKVKRMWNIDEVDEKNIMTRLSNQAFTIILSA